MGFTLVELLVAVTMLSVLFVGLGGHLRGGIVAWQRVQEVGDAVQRRRVAWDRLARDLAHAVVYDARQEVYGDGPDQLPPPVFGGDALAFYTVRSETYGQLPEVRFVTYRCQAEGGGSGLWRESRGVQETGPGDPALILPGCETLDVVYAYLPEEGSGSEKLRWQAEWPDPDGAEPLALPRLMRVTLRVDGGRPMSRLLTIPSGVFGGTAAGGGGS